MAGRYAKPYALCLPAAEGYQQKLLEKTGAANIALLVVFAAKNGLLED